LPDEVSQYQVCAFSPKTDGRGIKKKTDSLTANNTNKVNELSNSYAQSNPTKLKNSISIHASAPISNYAKKQESTENQVDKRQESQQQVAHSQTISPQNQLTSASLKTAVNAFAEGMEQPAIKEILMTYPIELKGKDSLTLFVNQPEHENLVSQIKNDLLAFLQQKFENPNLQFLIRKPYTDSEKLSFLKYKYNKVNELADKLGLDLI
jgi:hypothetical protein